jgi:hypothetical protein
MTNGSWQDFFGLYGRMQTSLSIAIFALLPGALGQLLLKLSGKPAPVMSQMISFGVDGVITDEPALGGEVLAEPAALSSTRRLLQNMAPLSGNEAPCLSIESNDAESDDENINLESGLHR